MSRRYPDEVEVAAHRHPTQDDLGDLFAPLSPPRRPTVTHAEQRALPIRGGTVEGDYAAWRATDSGQAVYEAIRRRALDGAHQGARRLSAKGLVEWARATLRVEINNTWTPHVARELADREPSLRPLFELRRRSAT